LYCKMIFDPSHAWNFSLSILWRNEFSSNSSHVLYWLTFLSHRNGIVESCHHLTISCSCFTGNPFKIETEFGLLLWSLCQQMYPFSIVTMTFVFLVNFLQWMSCQRQWWLYYCCSIAILNVTSSSSQACG
jgi:hypothetical protein